MLDTLRADVMGCYGSPVSATPELDALAEKGTVFERVVAPSSWTRPAVGAMLTGLHPRTLGLYDQRDECLADRFVTLPEALEAGGYRTIGHTANPNINSIFNFDQGFEEYHDSHVVFEWMAPTGDQLSRGEHPLIRAHEIFERILRLTDDESRFPYYVQLNLMEVHEWYRKGIVRQEYRGLFLEDQRFLYLQAARQLSDDVDAFVRELSRKPGWRNTVFVLVSDHGEGLYDHPLVADSVLHGELLYESNVIVPFVLYSPEGLVPARRVSRPVRLLDLFPTLLELAGAPVPEGTAGVSLTSFLEQEGEAPELPEYFVTETEFRESDKIAVYGAEWKYYEHRKPHEGLDPRELQLTGTNENGTATNRIGSNGEVADAMRSYLESWEAAHPKAAPTLLGQEISPEVIEQLESLGYLGETNAPLPPKP